MLKGERMEVVNSFKYLKSCFSSDRRVKEDISMRVGGGMIMFGAMKSMWKNRSLIVEVKRVLYERILVYYNTILTHTYETLHPPHKYVISVTSSSTHTYETLNLRQI